MDIGVSLRGARVGGSGEGETAGGSVPTRHHNFADPLDVAILMSCAAAVKFLPKERVVGSGDDNRGDLPSGATD
jgi:hypothetical protein